MYKINARTYQNVLKFRGEKEKNQIFFQKAKKIKDLTVWIDLDDKEVAELSFNFNNKKIEIPFLCNNTFITFSDISQKFKKVSFSTMDFSFNAFKSLDSQLIIEAAEKSNIEELGVKIKKSTDITLEESLLFSENVCRWGRGMRVWGNMNRLNKDNLAKQLKDWFMFAKDINSLDYQKIKKAIEMGDNIKGLGVSFASKHLRMINPNVFPVLDDVLAKGLGFALNENGYVLFIQNLDAFKSLNNNELISYSMANIEMSLFMLTRQLVRAN